MKFVLTKSLATEFLTQFVNKLNHYYNNFVQPGFYDRLFYNFQLTSGNRLTKIDYLFDEYLPNKYLFFSIEYKVKFLNFCADDVCESIAVCLPINAIDVFAIKVDKLSNLPDIKKDFAKYMHNVFGNQYKNSLKLYIQNIKEQELSLLEEQEKIAEQKIDYFSSFLEL